MDTSCLAVKYPITSKVKVFYPKDFNQTVEEGEIFATDETSNTITLKFPLPHTTLSYSVKSFNLSQIDFSPTPPTNLPNLPRITLCVSKSDADIQDLTKSLGGLTKVSLSSLKAREAHQLSLASDLITRQNSAASAAATRMYNVLLKACSQVEWCNITSTGKRQPLATNILVSRDTGGILVVEPYNSRKCVVSVNLGGGKKGEAERERKKDACERVRRIVESQQR